MIATAELVKYSNKLLRVSECKDYCPNGLQVQGKKNIKKIVSGVTACQALINAAVAAEADLLLVHHGFFWKGEDQTITGSKHARIKTLLAHDLNLLAYHLPLDAHPQLGNNAQLAKLLNITLDNELDTGPGLKFAFAGEFSTPRPAQLVKEQIAKVLKHDVLHIAVDKPIKSMAWCSGGAQSYMNLAIEAGVDAFLTGEASEYNFHQAKENNIHFFAAGHHATERYGVQALGEHLAETFSCQHKFIDIDNPI